MSFSFIYRLFPLFCILWGCGRGDKYAEDCPPTVNPDSIVQISPEEEILSYQTILSDLPTDSIYIRLDARIKLIELFHKNKQRPEAQRQLDTLIQVIIAENDRSSVFFIRAENLIAAEDFRENRLESALKHYQAAATANQALTVPDSAEFLKSFVNAGVILDRLRRYEEALKVYQTALPIAENFEFDKSDRLAKIYNNLGNTLNHLQRPHEAVIYFQKSTDFLYKYFPGDYPYTAKTQLYLGDALQLLGRLEEALGLYKQVLTIYDQNQTENPNQAEVYLRIANILKEKGDLEKAIDYYRQGLYIPTEDHVRAGIFHNLALVYLEARNLPAAHTSINEAEKIYRSLFPDNYSLQGQITLNRGLIFFYEQNFSEARQNFLTALDYFSQQYGSQSPYLIYVFYALGSLYEAENQWAKAETQYQYALDIALKTYGPNHFATARTYMNMATLAKKQKQFDQAEKLIVQSIQCLFPNYKPQSIIENPSFTDNVPAAAGSIIRILRTKAEILQDKGEFMADTTLLHASLGTFRFTLDLVNRIRTDLASEGSRELLEEKHYQLYEAGITTAWKLFEWTHDTTYLREAFALAESSKAHFLLDALKESQAKAFAGLPPSILLRERQIQDRLNLIEKKQYDAVHGILRPDSGEIVLWEKEQFALRQQYDSLKQNLEEKYPNYYQLRYDPKIAQLEDIQNVLADSTSFVTFFTGDSGVYVFIVTKTAFTARKINIPDLKTKIMDIRSGILDWYYQTNLAEIQKTLLLNSYASASASLFQELLGPVHEVLPKYVVFVPDGVLGYLPFELLLTETADTTESPSRWPYLLRKHAISYNYSATLYYQNRKTAADKPTGKGLIAFAPKFDKGAERGLRKSVPDEDFEPLRYNLEEAYKVAKIANGKTLLGEEATVQNFYTQAPSRAVIHLSSHGKADDSDARYSYIAFADPGDSSQKQLLYVADLYNLTLKADMVVLSACETGLGQLYRGEGMASLARAFTYAGARSITTTLWRVNDKTSADLMVKYYEYLAAGLPKDRALQQAKLDFIYIENHPFFWGGFVIMGDTDVLPIAKFTLRWKIITIVLLLLLGGIFLYFGYEYYHRHH